MTALVVAVFLASLLGSTHCAGMCGAFVVLAVSSMESNASRLMLNAAYNIGRLLTYITLGGVAGAVGASIDLGTSLVGLQKGAAVLAGAFMVIFGVTTLLRLKGIKWPFRAAGSVADDSRTGVMQHLALLTHRAALHLPPLPSAVAIGMLTTLLPCGWLYAFVVTAAGTGSPSLGAGLMAVFWLGTLPMMVTLGASASILTGRLRQHLPVMTSTVVVIVGLWTAISRVPLPDSFMRHGLNTAAQATPARTDSNRTNQRVPAESLLQRVESLEAEEMPCCHDGAQ